MMGKSGKNKKKSVKVVKERKSGKKHLWFVIDGRCIYIKL
jgi:hypothetical protein